MGCIVDFGNSQIPAIACFFLEEFKIISRNIMEFRDGWVEKHKERDFWIKSK